jgi:hypothetical protein
LESGLHEAPSTPERDPVAPAERSTRRRRASLPDAGSLWPLNLVLSMCMHDGGADSFLP